MNSTIGAYTGYAGKPDTSPDTAALSRPICSAVSGWCSKRLRSPVARLAEKSTRSVGLLVMAAQRSAYTSTRRSMSHMLNGARRQRIAVALAGRLMYQGGQEALAVRRGDGRDGAPAELPEHVAPQQAVVLVYGALLESALTNLDRLRVQPCAGVMAERQFTGLALFG
jgi:hypothetical protein